MANIPPIIADVISKIDGPNLEGKKLDYVKLFAIVMSLGGFQEVCVKVCWKDVLDYVGLTGNSFQVIVGLYKTNLLQFERHLPASSLIRVPLKSVPHPQTVSASMQPVYSQITAPQRVGPVVQQQPVIKHPPLPLLETSHSNNVMNRLFHLKRRNFLTDGVNILVEISELVGDRYRVDDPSPALYFYRCPNLLDIISDCLSYWQSSSSSRKRKSTIDNDVDHSEDICSLLTLCYVLMCDKPVNIPPMTHNCVIQSPDFLNSSYSSQHSQFIQQLAILIDSPSHSCHLLALDVFSQLAPFVDYSRFTSSQVDLFLSNVSCKSDQCRIVEYIETKGSYSDNLCMASSELYKSSLRQIISRVVGNVINQSSNCYSHGILKSIEILIKLSSNTGNSGLWSVIPLSDVLPVLFRLMSSSSNPNIAEGLLTLAYGICETANDHVLKEVNIQAMQTINATRFTSSQINQLNFISSRVLNASQTKTSSR